MPRMPKTPEEKVRNRRTISISLGQEAMEYIAEKKAEGFVISIFIERLIVRACRKGTR